MRQGNVKTLYEYFLLQWGFTTKSYSFVHSKERVQCPTQVESSCLKYWKGEARQFFSNLLYMLVNINTNRTFIMNMGYIFNLQVLVLLLNNICLNCKKKINLLNFVLNKLVLDCSLPTKLYDYIQLFLLKRPSIL